MKFKNIVTIVLIAVILITLSFAYVLVSNKDKSVAVVKAESEPVEALAIDEPAEVLAVPEDIYVYVCGEVVSPGVYKLPNNSRVINAIDLAGGFTLEADKITINLAKIITDEQQIYVPKIGENEEKIIIEDNKTNEASLININTASADELKKLNGIGDVLSQNIINYREENGEFKSIDDIKNVSRIGEKLFAAIKDQITVN